MLGLAYLFSNLGLWNIPYTIWSWWPLVIIAVGLSAVLESRGRWGAWAVVLLGVLLQLSNLDLLPNNIWSTLWPLLLIWFGLTLLSRRQPWQPRGHRSASTESTVDLSAFFSGVNKKVASGDFQGGTLSATFGGIELDLREASIRDTATLNVSALFGGIEITVPKSWAVEVSGLPLFGGWEDRTESPKEPQGRLLIKGSATFGGVEIKN
jgi:predicted membrane protein